MRAPPLFGLGYPQRACAPIVARGKHQSIGEASHACMPSNPPSVRSSRCARSSCTSSSSTLPMRSPSCCLPLCFTHPMLHMLCVIFASYLDPLRRIRIRSSWLSSLLLSCFLSSEPFLHHLSRLILRLLQCITRTSPTHTSLSPSRSHADAFPALHDRFIVPCTHAIQPRQIFVRAQMLTSPSSFASFSLTTTTTTTRLLVLLNASCCSHQSRIHFSSCKTSHPPTLLPSTALRVTTLQNSTTTPP
ncbi:hypothetical protein BKA62DRAFT_33220 [Auriculariales sp. MPI-PUGE-AT-0066]|nr:hypothetical protein BKA62DRAFT_33220 [Auriculariales sp. MPI-PUGE-AT-0066]